LAEAVEAFAQATFFMSYSLGCVVVVCGLIGSALSAAVKIEEEVVGPAPNPSLPSYKISSRGVHYAILTMKGSRSLVVVDGVAGPLFDELYSTTGERSLTAQNAVAFSPNGEHYAYLARTGGEYQMIYDGKEIYRAPYSITALRYGELQFSPGGKHVYFIAAELTDHSNATYRLVMDGKPGPRTGHQALAPVFSPDDTRWAYVARKVDGRDADVFTVVDGKEAGNLGIRHVFTADNRLLSVTANTSATRPALLIDGKPALKGVNYPDKIWIAPTGSRWAVAAQPKAGEPTLLFVDGKPLTGATDPRQVVFSSDGKRYLAECHTATSAFVVTDGKAGAEYLGVSRLLFSPDSSKAFYLAQNGSKSFLVVNGEESEGFEYLAGQTAPLAMSKTGGRYGYGTFDGMNRTFSAVVDGKSVLPPGRRVAGDSFVFSADGKHYAFATLPATRNDDQVLMIDGAAQEIAPSEFPLTQWERAQYVMFSPDGKHTAWRGVSKREPNRSGLAVDGKLVTQPMNFVRRPTFTPDSQHLLWAVRETSTAFRPRYQLYVDGRPTLTFEESFEAYPWSWEMGEDGVLQFLAFDGPVIKRYRVKADSDTSVATMGQDYSAAEAKALADAEKAKADAKEAQARAQAESLAAQAKAKADADAAYAEKTKARQEAIAAKQRAREEAIAAKQKARADALAAKRASAGE
jgi:hypothetical protein